MLDPIYNAFGSALAFFYAVVPNEGVAIILLTVAVMLVLFPLTAKSARSMLAMQRLQPEIKKLQAKHKGDRQKLNEEMMKLYQEHKVNPLGGCLPLVVQMPVFIALFHVLRSPLSSVPAGSSLFKALVAAKPGGLTFLSMDLSVKATDSHTDLAVAVPYYVLVALVVFVGYLQSRQTARNTPPGANNQMMMIGKVLPIAFGVFSLYFPAGLVLYFLTSNLWRLGQQELIMRKVAPRDHLRKDKAIDAKSSTTKTERAKPAEPAPIEAGDGAERVAEEAPEAAEPAAPAKAAKPAKSARAAKPAPVPRQSPLGALRDLFRPPADGKAGGNNNTPAPKPKPAASKEPAGQRGGSNRAGQSRRRRRRSSNKKRKR